MSENFFEGKDKIVPQEKMWVICDKYESPGKIRSINWQKKVCIISFFNEYSGYDIEGGMSEFEVPFSDITKSIMDMREKDRLNKEERGMKKIEIKERDFRIIK